ncbi:paraquat-inducible protein A, partial [Klebsiella pneumoniae]
LLKIASMMLLLVSTQRGDRRHRIERARLYRIMEFIGHWSMLDVFAVALLVALVHFGPLAQAEPGGGIIAFGAVVVLTMLATMSFDPRLIWDAAPS